MEDANGNPCSQELGVVADNSVGSSCVVPIVVGEGDGQNKAVKRRIGIPDSTTQTIPKRFKYSGRMICSTEIPVTPDTSDAAGQKCDNCDPARNRYLYMKNKAREMNNYCTKLNVKMKELVKTNVELATLLLSLLEAVDIPGSPKLVGSAMHLGEGETKKAVLDRINLLLERAGLANFPGPLGEILYNDLFMELRNAQME